MKNLYRRYFKNLRIGPNFLAPVLTLFDLEGKERLLGVEKTTSKILELATRLMSICFIWENGRWTASELTT